MKTLAIGSGIMKPDQNTVRLDISPETGADVIWDLNVIPYPFEDSTFDRIECLDVIEHVSNIPLVMQECHRILKDKGIFYITTPHFSSNNSYIDPTHRYHLSFFSFDCFSDEHKYHYYSKARFKMIQKKMMFDGAFFRKAFFTKLANRFPSFYERRLTWIFPAWFLYFELQAIKNKN